MLGRFPLSRRCDEYLLAAAYRENAQQDLDAMGGCLNDVVLQGDAGLEDATVAFLREWIREPVALFTVLVEAHGFVLLITNPAPAAGQAVVAMVPLGR